MAYRILTLLDPSFSQCIDYLPFTGTFHRSNTAKIKVWCKYGLFHHATERYEFCLNEALVLPLL